MNGYLKLSYDVNNAQTLTLSQERHDGPVTVEITNPKGVVEYAGDRYTIQPGDMVMLLNLYRHIKDCDIRNDFINPYGRTEE